MPVTTKVHEKNAARVRESVKRNLRGAEVIKMYEIGVVTHGKYWERCYIVAWRGKGKDTEFGTHRVCINGEPNSQEYPNNMCLEGNYQMTEEEALVDAKERAYAR